MKKTNLLIFANIITLSIFLGGCSQVNVNQRDIASSDSYDMKISDCKLPASSLKNNIEIKVSRTEFSRKEEMVNRLKLLVNCINYEVEPSIDIPKKLFFNLFHDRNFRNNDRIPLPPSFLPASSDDIIKGNKYSVINMPLISFQQPNVDNMDLAMIFSAHEYGHYLFTLNIVKKSMELKETQDKFETASRNRFKLLAIENSRTHFNDYLQHIYYTSLQEKCNVIAVFTVEGGLKNPKFWNCLQANLPEQYKVLYEKKLKLDAEYGKYKNIDYSSILESLGILKAQSELFADIVAVLHFENPTVLTVVERDFSKRQYSLSKFRDLDVHEYYSLIRSDIWNLYKKSHLSKGEFLKRVLDAMIINFKKTSKYSSDKTMNNVSLLKDIAKEVYLH